MKHKAKLLVLMMVTACSTESKTGAGPTSAGQVLEDVSQDADAIEEREDIASAETIATPVEAPQESAGLPPPESQPEVIAEEQISPPHQVTGAYLTATLLPPATESGPLRVGLFATKDDQRLTEDDGRYRMNWQLTFSQVITNPVKIVPSDLRAFDQVIEFYGSATEFEAVAGSINVYLQVSETGSTLNSLVSESLSKLVEGQSVPESADPAEEEEPETPVETPPEEPVLTDVEETKPEPPAETDEPVLTDVETKPGEAAGEGDDAEADEPPVVTEVESDPKQEPLLVDEGA